MTCRHMFAGLLEGMNGRLIGNGKFLLAQVRPLQLLIRYRRGILMRLYLGLHAESLLPEMVVGFLKRWNRYELDSRINLCDSLWSHAVVRLVALQFTKHVRGVRWPSRASVRPL